MIKGTFCEYSFDEKHALSKKMFFVVAEIPDLDPRENTRDAHSFVRVANHQIFLVKGSFFIIEGYKFASCRQ
jgi:hypothetical protein